MPAGATLVREPMREVTSVRRTPESDIVTLLADAQRTKPLRLLLDYDGTLVPIARSPELASPDEELTSLLRELAHTPRLQLDVVSGRDRETLERWFGHLPVTLWAEHGFWHRPFSDKRWRAVTKIALSWIERVQPILEQFTASTPGSQVEIKSASIAWHFRRAQREFGARQAHALHMLLGDVLSNQPLEVIEGKRVIEVRLRGVSKALVAHRVRAEASTDTLVVAIGDDRTDEDLFRELPPTSATIVVGNRPSSARFRVTDSREVRRVIRSLVVSTVREEAR